MITFHEIGKCSTFGGPNDSGMTPNEGLALYASGDPDPYKLFCGNRDRRGMALNPASFYCAMRWDYTKLRTSTLKALRVIVTNLSTGKQIVCHPADWGPNSNTGRIIDLSPGAATALAVTTDTQVGVSYAY